MLCFFHTPSQVWGSCIFQNVPVTYEHYYFFKIFLYFDFLKKTTLLTNDAIKLAATKINSNFLLSIPMLLSVFSVFALFFTQKSKKKQRKTHEIYREKNQQRFSCQKFHLFVQLRFFTAN